MEMVYKKENTLYTILFTLSMIIWIVLIVGTLGIGLIYLLLGFVIYVFAQSGFIAYLKGTAVIIDRAQFPDLAERIERCSQKLNVPTPTAFLLNGNGLLNAFATRFLGTHYIALYSDVVDALEDHPDAIDFYIGHELGHIKRNHLSKSVWVFPMRWLPLLGAAYSRACEYTCDRHGLACCSKAEDAHFGLGALAAGGKRWKTLKQAEYAQQAHTHRGFWISFHELCADYPWLTKRMSALLQLAERREPKMPGRNPFAFLLALFVPRTGVPGAGGAVGMLMVVAIIGILAAVAIPAYADYTHRAHFSLAYQQSIPLQNAIADYGNTNKQWPDSLEQLGISGLKDISYEGKGIIKISAPGQGTMPGVAFYLVPQISNNTIAGWKCEVESANLAKSLPPQCRK